MTEAEIHAQIDDLELAHIDIGESLRETEFATQALFLKYRALQKLMDDIGVDIRAAEIATERVFLDFKLQCAAIIDDMRKQNYVC